MLQEPQSKISRHLSSLRAAELVEGRKHGLWMHYTLSQRGARMFPAFVHGLCGDADHMQELQADLHALRAAKATLVAYWK